MRAFLMGFVYAGRGVLRAVREERNLRFHLCAAVYVLLFSLFYPLSRAEYGLLFLVISLVFAAEMVNTSIEHIVDQICPGQNATAGLAKDIAAGAVLMVCVGAAVCGLLLFWDVRVFAAIAAFFADRLPLLGLLLLSVGASGWFVFGLGAASGKKNEKEVK